MYLSWCLHINKECKTATKGERYTKDVGSTYRRLQAWLEQKWVKEETSQHGKLHSSWDFISAILPLSMDTTLQFLWPFRKYWLTPVPLHRVSWPSSLNWGYIFGPPCSVLPDSYTDLCSLALYCIDSDCRPKLSLFIGTNPNKWPCVYACVYFTISMSLQNSTNTWPIKEPIELLCMHHKWWWGLLMLIYLLPYLSPF